MNEYVEVDEAVVQAILEMCNGEQPEPDLNKILIFKD